MSQVVLLLVYLVFLKEFKTINIFFCQALVDYTISSFEFVIAFRTT